MQEKSEKEWEKIWEIFLGRIFWNRNEKHFVLDSNFILQGYHGYSCSPLCFQPSNMDPSLHLYQGISRIDFPLHNTNGKFYIGVVFLWHTLAISTGFSFTLTHVPPTHTLCVSNVFSAYKYWSAHKS